MKTATVVQFDRKEIETVLIEHAKSVGKIADPGGRTVKFLVEEGKGLSGAVIRFGQSVADDLVDVEVVYDEDDASIKTGTSH